MKTGYKRKKVSSVETGFDCTPEPAVNPEIEREATAIERVFVEARRAVVPGAAGCAKPQRKYFIKAAEIARRLGESPEVFVNTQIGYLLKTGSMLYPQGLASETVTTGARDVVISTADIDLHRYQLQLDRWKRYVSIGSPEGILRTVWFEFTPLMRFTMATHYKLPGIAEACREEARREFLASPTAQHLFLELCEVFK